MLNSSLLWGCSCRQLLCGSGVFHVLGCKSDHEAHMAWMANVNLNNSSEAVPRDLHVADTESSLHSLRRDRVSWPSWDVCTAFRVDIQKNDEDLIITNLRVLAGDTREGLVLTFSLYLKATGNGTALFASLHIL
ncbi:hypothetical protein P153DRAFT_40835 [Dothidotthia symphoricarpi CBS 119687]|uniref:Uncharacterized protein n=1 Tax=Dothidotthia symphoricarpi CBS 119687 TaxID=1392245 RepID=A0A6A6ACX4_9PLEO|nr:uncharacterized protein P153DRAFT_40835 [Dothidotthia symphoricarpi CBS 119687]KAF2128591.1 hypothetical protein P153DRAFT_40835 [Dothidotthia symphoricarpi CBS 119687]